LILNDLSIKDIRTVSEKV
jgi:glutaminase